MTKKSNYICERVRKVMPFIEPANIGHCVFDTLSERHKSLSVKTAKMVWQKMYENIYQWIEKAIGQLENEGKL